MSADEIKYGAILVDTSIFDGNGLKLEKGLLGKLAQFKKSPIEYILPDVVKNEVQRHLETRISTSRAALEKALNEAGDHLFFDGSELNDAKKMLIDSKEVNGLAESRMNKFIDSTGALVLETGSYVSVSDLLSKYFSNEPPFAETGKKKNEFPDAIVLMAVEAWADKNDEYVLAIAKDGDWKSFCQDSTRIDYQDDFSRGLEVFNQTNAPYTLLANLEAALISGSASKFLAAISSRLESALDGFTPDQEADSAFYWEADGSHGWFNDFSLLEHEFRIVDKDEDRVVLEALASISVEAEGEFSLSMYDSIDRDHVSMGGVTVQVVREFESEILITISGDLNGPIDELSIDEVEIVSPINTIDFGYIEPEYDDYEE